ncbi:WS/DGAT/MGAT family O-acyltransferase [Microvirga alba]|uniref:diacylglycerol O-acyltransferase n=1 Tax=Microvirga alba TaxID=2791025 RepID=A0A931BRT1_9HYPH|nr:wax ester/triacylglycerol synthase family O-acyltransferase [Microvirga alba]MBF9234519.1 wax ester/triacylglycerol synthase family O-acyltransferase [Microvirga alba]
MSNTERMSAVDTTWLRMDQPNNLMQIVGILELEPPVILERIENALSERLLRFDRFRQRVEDRSGILWWSEDLQFDITRHIKRVRLPTPGGKGELQRYVAELAMTPLDPNRPLWQFHVVEHDRGGATVVARIHHAIADGMALLTVMLSLVDGEQVAMTNRRPPSRSREAGLLESILRPVSEGLRFSGEVWRKGLGLAGDPTQTLRQGTSIAAELAHLALMPSDSQTRFKGQLSGNKRVAWTDPIALPDVLAVSNALGCSINDMLLAAVAGALNGYLEDNGDETKGVEIRALVPINLRPPGIVRELGNRFGVVAIELPIGLANPLARLYEVHRRMEALKSSFEPPVTLGLLEALGYAPKIVQDQVFELLLSRASAVITNVPGPREPLYLAGSKIRQIMYWVPQPGEIGLGVSILSYNGQVQFGLITDAALVPDPEAIVARFEPEFDQLLYFVLLGPGGEEWPEERIEKKAKPERELKSRKRRLPRAVRAMPKQEPR